MRGDSGAAPVRALRDSGLGDGGIHDAAAVTAYFNFVNRIALGLGVELETPGGGPMTGTVNDPTGNPRSGP